jgi:hypothetical protein
VAQIVILGEKFDENDHGFHGTACGRNQGN